MRFNLHLTHWSLFFVTLISSCFLFYVVASEYASTTTTQKPDAANLMTSAGFVSNNADAATTNPLPLPMQSAVGADANTNPNAFVASNEPKRFNENHNNAAKTINIMPNYKKLKKQLTKQLLRTGKTSSVASPEQQQTKSFEEEERNVQRPTEGEAIMQTFNKLSEKSSVNSLNDNLDKNLLNNLDLNNNNNINNNNNNLNNKHEQQQEQQQNLPDVVQIPAEMSKIISNEEQQQQQNNDNVADNSNVNLPDLTDIPPPTLTVTEIPLEILQPATQLDSAIVLDDSNSKHQNDRVNQTIEIIVNASAEQMQKDEQIVKINDPGGGAPAAVSADEEQLQQQTLNANNIPMTDNAAGTTTATPSTTNNTQQQQTEGSALGSSEQEQQQQQLEENATATPNSTPPSQVNLTTEEVPIPVFSEWAQKQIEAAEKEAVEQEQTQFNNSAQRKNNTSGNGKPPALKIRAKNYASPSCGAKIIAASAYTSNAGAVLSSSSDEYMLSTCGNRIWFVVELCEAIQAQKIDFANFELYSSSPQNFSVAVSKRFPTRDWSNVGRFEAEDKRGVQSFDLHPQLFGKFVRVDISSHYSKEHYCTLSLFRVFGTSEFEAFETENHPNEDIDDFEDEYGQEQNTMKNAEQNLFKSASDAVLSIVKKATEVLVKPSNQQNQTIKTSQQKVVCRTPVFGSFSCAECSHMLVERINNALSCEFTQLNSLLSVAELKRDLLQTQICAKQYGIELQRGLLNEKDIRQSYYVNLLPNDYVGALCQLMATPEQIHLHVQNTAEDDNADEDGPELSSNLTIENKLKNNALNVLEKPKNKLIKPPQISADQGSSGPASTIHTSEPLQVVETSTEPSADSKQNQEQQLSRPIESDLEILETTTSQPSEPAQPTKSATPPATVEPTAPLPTQIPDRNMFNVPANDLSLSQETEGTAMQDELKNVNEENVESINDSNEQQHASLPPQTTTPAPAAQEHTSTTPTPLPAAVPTAPPTVPSVKSEEDISSWDNIDNLLASNPSGTASGNIVQQQQNNNNVAVGSSGNMQQKQSSGPQSESVFIRLSNRIKTLERNMSLSGQYLEELSRRYKKQVEELQVSLTQQQQTVRTLEEENRKHQEMEQLHAMRNTQLKEQLDDLTLQVHACIVVIIFVGAFVFLVLTIGILFYRSLRRETKDIVALYGKAGGSGAKKKVTVVTGETANQKKINRRKSFDDYSDHQKSVGKCIGSASTGAIGSKQDKYRRPSEAAMMILKDCKEREDKRVNQLAAANRNSLEQQQYDVSSSSALPRQRKISVCYGSNNNINNGELNNLPAGKTHGGGKQRKGEKHSWPNSAQSQQMAWRHLEELHSDDRTGERTEDSFRSTDLKTSYSSRKPPLMNGHSFGGIGAVGNKSKKKKDNPAYKRQESAPCTAASYQQQQHLLLNNTAPSVLLNSTVDFDESLMLDSDDLDNFIPTTDLAYNEFMPDGPSGYQCLQTTTQQANTSTNAIMPASAAATKSKKSAKFSSPDAKTNKSRRLSSPVFFKSPFSKSLKGKISSSSSTSKSSSNNTPHESTSWEWYRLKKSSSNTVATADTRTAAGNTGSSQALLTTSASVPTNAFSRISPNCSLQDSSSSLSEINFPTTNSNNSQSLLTPSDRNSFRILEEAILSSGESIICNKAPSNRAVANSLKTDRHNNVAAAAVGGGNVAAAAAAHCSTSSSNSNRSSSSSTNSSTNNQTKKKNRSFNKIFRKVF